MHKTIFKHLYYILSPTEKTLANNADTDQSSSADANQTVPKRAV